MRPAVEVRALDDAEALGAIERALHGKLRAHRLSESFIERHGEDVVQQGIAEYERALARGSEIDNPGGWIVSTAYRRAIDELRRELREIDEADLPAKAGMVDGGDLFSPTEEEALDNVSAEQLRETIAKLSAQQRQALGLYYFEERTTREAAAVLGCGETTFRRHLRSALRVLRQRFGVVPEPGSELAIEIGLLAWASLAGARVVPGRNFLDQRSLWATPYAMPQGRSSSGVATSRPACSPPAGAKPSGPPRAVRLGEPAASAPERSRPAP